MLPDGIGIARKFTFFFQFDGFLRKERGLKVERAFPEALKILAFSSPPSPFPGRTIRGLSPGNPLPSLGEMR
jgi:hypothetical protein